jgi:glycerophosphoryl diester phosphodiesterase
MSQLRIGAHRGAMCHAPENTLAAFERAIELGAYRIEFDLRRSRDGHLVVIHDATVDRTTDGSGAVADMSLAELKKLRSGDQTIPTLAETIDCIGTRSLMLPEFKDTDIAAQAVQQLEAAGVTAQCTLSSFDEPSLLEARRLNPQIKTAYFLVEPKDFDAAETAKRLGTSLLIVWPRAATPEYISDAHRHGMQVRCGFRDDMSYEESYQAFCHMADMGADEFSSGRPDWIARMIAAYGKK